MSSIERKVWIFKTAEVKPTREDSFGGYVLAMNAAGDWVPMYIDLVVNDPEWYIEWMQYPDLVQHRKMFGEVDDETD